uniref:Uncharacterized protein ycf33 n=1 Tax=Ceramothamnion japonicum TaxID=218448 RepID=A0A1C9CDJ9_CERJP|nr:hypothetical protein Ceram_161 [Ceramium japonicum]AOM66437.1 hypothetical protein Ceram_161 [Ceramium japonicum]
MNNFWNNIYKFPTFFISVVAGFFLVSIRPILQAFKNKKYIIPIIIIFNTIIYITYIILKKMLDIN